MSRRRLSTDDRCRLIGMKNGGMLCRAIARKLGCLRSVITILIKNNKNKNTNKTKQKNTPKVNDVKDGPTSGRPKTTSVREARNLLRLVRRTPTSSVHTRSNQRNTNRLLSVQTDREPTEYQQTTLRADG